MISMLGVIEGMVYGSTERTESIITFVRSFVPSVLFSMFIFTTTFNITINQDVTEDDITDFSGSLIQDKEFCSSMYREIKCCATGELVEKIEEKKKGGTKKVIIFTILPPAGVLEVIIMI